MIAESMCCCHRRDPWPTFLARARVLSTDSTTSPTIGTLQDPEQQHGYSSWLGTGYAGERGVVQGKITSAAGLHGRPVCIQTTVLAHTVPEIDSS
jgi:hypothetical protein